MATCFSCSASLDDLPLPIGRRDSCEKCRADVHVCKNCEHYDTNSYNDCREPMADRVVDKEKSNFCDYFKLRQATTAAAEDPKAAALKSLEDLFKK